MLRTLVDLYAPAADKRQRVSLCFSTPRRPPHCAGHPYFYAELRTLSVTGHAAGAAGRGPGGAACSSRKAATARCRQHPAARAAIARAAPVRSLVMGTPAFACDVMLSACVAALEWRNMLAVAFDFVAQAPLLGGGRQAMLARPAALEFRLLASTHRTAYAQLRRSLARRHRFLDRE